MQETDIKQIDVKVSKPYTVYVGEGIGGFINEQIRDKRIYVITDSNVHRFYGEFLKGLSNYVYVFEAGEKNKNYKTLLGIYDFLIENGGDRYSCIVGLGGGVVGDIAGFAASTYMRGIDLVHIPTTLLAMVDSSIGGKTGINYHDLKNVVGSFYQPRAVYVDVNFLKTLPEREYISAFAEIIKYGIIKDKELFEFLEQNTESLLKRDTKALKIVVERSIKNKVEIVEKDEKEKGLRAILNFGHTFAHAIESITEYKKYYHGEAVTIGMVEALKVSKNMGLINQNEAERVVKLIENFGLPTKLKLKVNKDRMLEIMLKDKKNKNSSLRLVLTKGIGSSIIAGGINSELILDVIGENRKENGRED